MAIKELKPAKSKLKVKNKKAFLCTFVAFIILTAVCFGIKISNDVKIETYRQKTAEVQLKVDELNAENEEKLSVLNSTDKRDFFERYAREYYDYAKPGEYVFYKAES